MRRHPDAVAAEHAGRRWTYRELNARANRIAHALRARGLAAEGVVAVATERNLDWMASVIAVFKAGGVYLPIEPHLPADRIATTLRRAECGIVLTEPGSTGTLDQALPALPGVQRVLVETVYAEQHPDTDPGVPVGPDQLAYIYFTSGSTGEPKGAMCEHAGMLNHLQAKIADLEIGEGQTVAQTAPQCFDISLWQLISALLVGGRTLLVPQDVILDVARFVDTIADGRVNVLQIVPSYLEVVLTYLEQHPRPEGGAVLPDLHCASVTGEALKLELAQRWFSVMPGIKLVNAYGLTETSDDTNHEVMRSAPEGRSVPLGPAVQNVRVYVVDEKLRPVPLGAPGAIVFSGVCVGRGYINDPERTAAAYLTDPHRPGERLYQAGDFGRWRPDGKLEFLGRRDSQVKISGFRIEIGEIENILLRVPGVRDGAVVVADGPGGTKHLVAFYAADRPLSLGPAPRPARRVAARLHGARRVPLAGGAAADRQQQDRQEGADRAGRRARRRRRGRGAPGHPDRAAAGRRVGDGARGAGRAGRAAGPLLRQGRHVAVRGQGGHRAQAGGVAQGDHPPAGAGRPGRAGRRPDRAADRPAADPRRAGAGRGGGHRAGLLPLRGRQRGELPADGRRAARQRARGVRRRAARARPGRGAGAVRCRSTRSWPASWRSSTASWAGAG